MAWWSKRFTVDPYCLCVAVCWLEDVSEMALYPGGGYELHFTFDPCRFCVAVC